MAIRRLIIREEVVPVKPLISWMPGLDGSSAR